MVMLGFKQDTNSGLLDEGCVWSQLKSSDADADGFTDGSGLVEYRWFSRGSWPYSDLSQRYISF